jgi:hypothetical protein
MLHYKEEDDDWWGDHPLEFATNDDGHYAEINGFNITPGVFYTMTIKQAREAPVYPDKIYKLRVTGSITNATPDWCGTGCNTITITHAFEVNNAPPYSRNPQTGGWWMPPDESTLEGTVLRQPPGPPVWAYRFQGGQVGAGRMSVASNWNDDGSAPYVFDNFSGFACNNSKTYIPAWDGTNPYPTRTPSPTPTPGPSTTPTMVPVPTPIPTASPPPTPPGASPTPVGNPSPTSCPTPVCLEHDMNVCPIECPAGFDCDAILCGLADSNCCCTHN